MKMDRVIYFEFFYTIHAILQQKTLLISESILTSYNRLPKTIKGTLLLLFLISIKFVLSCTSVIKL